MLGVGLEISRGAESLDLLRAGGVDFCWCSGYRRNLRRTYRCSNCCIRGITVPYSRRRDYLRRSNQVQTRDGLCCIGAWIWPLRRNNAHGSDMFGVLWPIADHVDEGAPMTIQLCLDSPRRPNRRRLIGSPGVFLPQLPQHPACGSARGASFAYKVITHVITPKLVTSLSRQNMTSPLTGATPPLRQRRLSL